MTTIIQLLAEVHGADLSWYMLGKHARPHAVHSRGMMCSQGCSRARHMEVRVRYARPAESHARTSRSACRSAVCRSCYTSEKSNAIYHIQDVHYSRRAFLDAQMRRGRAQQLLIASNHDDENASH